MWKTFYQSKGSAQYNPFGDIALKFCPKLKCPKYKCPKYKSPKFLVFNVRTLQNQFIADISTSPWLTSFYLCQKPFGFWCHNLLSMYAPNSLCPSAESYKQLRNPSLRSLLEGNPSLNSRHLWDCSPYVFFSVMSIMSAKNFSSNVQDGFQICYLKWSVSFFPSRCHVNNIQDRQGRHRHGRKGR